MSYTTPPEERWTALSRFMVDASRVPDPRDLTEHALEALAYVRVPSTHPEHSHWREAYLRRIAAHLSVRATLAPLVRTWREHGIEVLLFKGFYLAEFVYENPAERFYKDVDILVPEADAVTAIALAYKCGWTVRSRRTAVGSHPNSHMEAILERANVWIDLHRFVVHQDASPDDRLARRYTAAVWAASREVPWQDVTVRVLDARDSALLGLITSRAWSHDGWCLKVPDYRDLEVLAEREGLTRDALSARASEFGCPLTLRLLLDRCDPWRGHLDMTPPTRAQVRRWNRAVSLEHGPRSRRSRLVPNGASIGGVVRALPGLMRARLLVARYRDAAALLEHVRWRHEGGSELTSVSRLRVFGSVRLASILAQPSGDRCLVRSVALFERLRAHGEPVRLRVGADAVGRLHGWVHYKSDADDGGPVNYWLQCAVSELRGSLPPEVLPQSSDAQSGDVAGVTGPNHPADGVQ